MRFISFSYLTPAVLDGTKTVTRRDWKDSFAKGFRGKPVATIRLALDPYKEDSRNVPASDWALEGFDWLDEHDQGDKAWAIWKDWTIINPRPLWVIRFELVEWP